MIAAPADCPLTGPAHTPPASEAMSYATAVVSRRTVLALLAACVLAAACASRPAEPPLPEIKAAPVLGSVAPDRATLYFFNVGEGSAIGTGRGQDITDNGAALVAVARETYTVVTLPPGQRVLGNRFDPRRVLRIDLRAGEVYYVLVGYKPELDWARPLAVDGFVFGQTSEARARELAASYRRIEPRR